jgi:hypothetical protein
VSDAIEVITETLYSSPPLALLGSDDCEVIGNEIALKLMLAAKGDDDWVSLHDMQTRIGAFLMDALTARGRS